MTKGIIYYTDNRLDEEMNKKVRGQIFKSGLPVVSCSLKPIDFGKNIVLDLERGPVTMVRQILTALESSEAEYVFFASMMFCTTRRTLILHHLRVIYFITTQTFGAGIMLQTRLLLTIIFVLCQDFAYLGKSYKTL